MNIDYFIPTPTFNLPEERQVSHKKLYNQRDRPLGITLGTLPELDNTIFLFDQTILFCESPNGGI